MHAHEAKIAQELFILHRFFFTYKSISLLVKDGTGVDWTMLYSEGFSAAPSQLDSPTARLATQTTHTVLISADSVVHVCDPAVCCWISHRALPFVLSLENANGRKRRTLVYFALCASGRNVSQTRTSCKTLSFHPSFVDSLFLL